MGIEQFPHAKDLQRRVDASGTEEDPKNNQSALFDNSLIPYVLEELHGGTGS